MTLPLSRFRVLEVTVARAGPAAGRHLADWGADVIRIEPPGSISKTGGDPTGARFGSDRFNLNRNKRSLTVNLKDPQGRKVFHDLVRQSDVVIENMRPGVKARLGFDYKTLSALNPRIILGSISGFGQTGPYAERPGVDQVVQGMSGLMSVTGLPGQGPVRVGIPLIDLTAGGFLAQAILIALLDRERTGVGSWVHTSLIEAAVALLDLQGMRWLMDGEVPEQAGNNHPTAIPTGVYPTADRPILIGAGGDRIWARFCPVLGVDHLIDDPRFRSSEARLKNRDALNEEIAAITATKSSDYWIEKLNAAGVPCGQVNTIDQTFADPQLACLDVTMEGMTDDGAPAKVLSQPNNIEGYRKLIRMNPPKLGEHTNQILGDLGISKADICALRDAQAI